MTSGTLKGSRTPRDELSVAKPRFAHANPDAPPPLRRLLALAWGYGAVCARFFAGQTASLALALGAHGASGLAIDVVRAAIDPGAPAVRWPLGITAPAGFGPGRTLIAVAAVAFAL